MKSDNELNDWELSWVGVGRGLPAVIPNGGS